MTRIALVLTFALIALDLAAQDALPPAVAPYVDGATVAVVRVDLDKIDVEKLFHHASVLVTDAKELAAMQAGVTGLLAKIKNAGVGTVYVTVNMADLQTPSPFGVIAPLAAGTDAAKAAGTLNAIEARDAMTVEAHGTALLAGVPSVLKRMRATTPAARPDLAAGLAAGKTAAVHAVFAPIADLRRVAEETLPTLPKEIGGGSVQVITKGLTWAALSFDTAPKLDATLTVQAKDAAAAKQINDLAQAGLKHVLAKLKDERVDGFEALVRQALTPKLAGDRLVSRVDEATFVKTFAEMAGPVREAAERTKSTNNLKQLALGMHQHLEAHGSFPADIVKDGKLLLSWRVRILPFIEQKALYDQFQLDEPWDSAHNKPLIAKMPALFVAPQQKSPAGTTTYLAPFGDGYFLRTKAPGEGMKITDNTDGTSTTIMLVEVADSAAVEWTKPADWTPDAKDPFKLLLGHYPHGTNTAFCDGSVRFLSKDIGVKLLPMLTVAGGEVAELP